MAKNTQEKPQSFRVSSINLIILILIFLLAFLIARAQLGHQRMHNIRDVVGVRRP